MCHDTHQDCSCEDLELGDENRSSLYCSSKLTFVFASLKIPHIINQFPKYLKLKLHPCLGFTLRDADTCYIWGEMTS